jgi:hypothetical protein
MPNAGSECNSQQTVIENGLKARYRCHFGEIGPNCRWLDL